MARSVLEIAGSDRESFLQGLITNDVTKAVDGIVYAALLTPQGKYIADFFVIGRPDVLWIDVDSTLASALAQRLTMYRLRADVQITETEIVVSRRTSPAKGLCLPDPRDAAMGYRIYGDADHSDDTNWAALRVAHTIPASGIELTAETYILEAGFERLGGIDFRKGCYVGQEIAARMKHKTELRKGLVQIHITGSAPVGTPIMANDKAVGTLFTTSGDRGLAHLRFDRATTQMTAGDAAVSMMEQT